MHEKLCVHVLTRQGVGLKVKHKVVISKLETTVASRKSQSMGRGGDIFHIYIYLHTVDKMNGYLKYLIKIICLK